MTVAHKNLTGTDLHEIKGADAATEGQVPIADGSGAAPFGLLTHESLDASGNPFGRGLLHVSESRAAGVDSATSATQLVWLTVALSTTNTNEITGASMAPSAITLPTGTYYCDISVPWQGASGGAIQACATRLFNNTTLSVQMIGTTVRLFGTSDNATLISRIVGRFECLTPTELVIQHYKTSGLIGGAGGLTNEVYTQAMFWKVR